MVAFNENQTEDGVRGVTEAAASVFSSQDVLNMIIRLLDPEDLPALRLASQELAIAVDNHTITALSIRRWNTKPIRLGSRRLKNAQSVTLHTAPDWEHLQKLASQLPMLHILSIPEKVNSRMSPTCAAALTSLTRLDLGTSSMQVPSIPLPKRGTSQLPLLQAASFSSRHTKAAPAGNGTLEDIAAFAPNLQQLYCQYLELHANSSSTRAVLPRCSHYGGQEVHIVNASSRASGGAAFARAFPRLRVFSCLPHTIKIAAEQKHHGKWTASPAELLALCKTVHSVRGFGAPTARCFDSSSSDKRSGQLQQLRALSVRCGMSSSCTLAAVGQLRSLTHLELLLNAPLSRHGPSATFRPAFLRDVTTILHQVQDHLTQLQVLALPAALLCSTCCNEGSGAAPAYSGLQRNIASLAGILKFDQALQSEDDNAEVVENEYNNGAAARGGSSSSSSSSAHGAVPMLRQLVFLDVQWPGHCSCYADSCWQQPQQHQQQIQAKIDQLKHQQTLQCMPDEFDAAETGSRNNDVSNGLDVACGQKIQRKAAVQLQLHVGWSSSSGLCLNNAAGEGVWGVYGPAKW